MNKNKHPTEKIGRNPRISERKKAKMKKLPAIGFGKINPSDFTPKKLIKKLRSANRNALLAASLGVVLVIVGIFSLVLSSSNTKEITSTEQTSETKIGETPPISAGINLIEGTLQTKNEAGEWVDAEEDLEIVESTALRTSGAASRASVTLEDGSILRLDGNSEIEFNTLTTDRVEVKHVSGYTYSRIPNADSRQYIVKTTEAQYEARGTAFRTAASGDEQAVEVYHNSVLETSTNITAKEGEKLTVKSRVRPSENKTIQKLDIEIIKKDQFIEWNRELDAQSDLYKNQLGFLQDVTSPEVTITSPKDGATILLEPKATQGSVEFSGNTERGTNLTIQSKSNGGAQPVTVQVADNGSFTSPVISSPLGSSVFEITAKDKTGNTTTKTIRITFQAKSGAVTGGSIVLSTAFFGSDKIKATWAFSGSASAPDGVRIVYSTNKNPTLSDDSTSVVKSSTSTTIDVDKFDSNKTYYFRACIYDKNAGDCSSYSDQTSLDIP